MVNLTGAHLYLRVGGAYCDLCSGSKEECMIRENTNKVFIINRNVQSLHDIFNGLVQEDGRKKVSSDYQILRGETTRGGSGGFGNPPPPPTYTHSTSICWK